MYVQSQIIPTGMCEGEKKHLNTENPKAVIPLRTYLNPADFSQPSTLHQTRTKTDMYGKID